jgi:hypothetical protein
MNQTRHIIALNSALRDVIEFRQQEVDENGHPIRNTAIGVGGVGAVGGTGYALYRRGLQMPGEAGTGVGGVFNNMRAGVTGFRQDMAGMRESAQPTVDKVTGAVSGATAKVRGVASDIGGRASGYGQQIAGSRVGQFAQRTGRYARNVGSGLAEVAGHVPTVLGSEARAAGVGMGDAARFIGRGLKKVAHTKFSSRARIISLSDELRDILFLG